MAKKIKIRKIPSWVIWLRIVPNGISVALAPYIFLDKEKYGEYRVGSVTYKTEAIITHESVHIKHEQAIGLWKFLFLYFFSKAFCLKEELEAIKEEMGVYKAHDQQFDIESRARALSAFWMYHHCVTFDDAKKLLDAVWHQT